MQPSLGSPMPSGVSVTGIYLPNRPHKARRDTRNEMGGLAVITGLLHLAIAIAPALRVLPV